MCNGARNSCVKQQQKTAGASRFDFGSLSHDYDRWYATPPGRANDLAQKKDVLQLLPLATTTGQRLLDVGCGTGHWSGFFATLGYAVVGIDISPEMISVARRQRRPELAFQVADAGALPFKDASFAIAAAMATIEFTVSPPCVLKEMARCVVRKGRILIGTLNGSAPLNRQRVEEGREPYASAQLYSAEELCALLSPFGRLRMVASIPGERNDSDLRINPDAPFIVAEIQR